MLPPFVTAHRNANPPGCWVLRTELGGTREQAQRHVDVLRALGYDATVVQLVPIPDLVEEEKHASDQSTPEAQPSQLHS